VTASRCFQGWSDPANFNWHGAVLLGKSEIETSTTHYSMSGDVFIQTGIIFATAGLAFVAAGFWPVGVPPTIIGVGLCVFRWNQLRRFRRQNNRRFATAKSVHAGRGRF